MAERPPEMADRLLVWYCSDHYAEELIGDLHEWYGFNRSRHGKTRADLMYWSDVIRLMTLYRFKTYSEFFQNSNDNNMIKNHMVIAWRHLTKKKEFALINLTGLTIGICTSLLLLIYAQYEFSYDKFHDEAASVYRVHQDRYNNGELATEWAAGASAIGPVLSDNMPEIKEYVKMNNITGVLSHGEKSFFETKGYFATPSFFGVFTVSVVNGSYEQFDEPFKIALSEKAANKYFGEEDAVGQVLTFNGRDNYDVVAVYQDIPDNSHFDIDVLFSFQTAISIMGEQFDTEWNWDGFYTYLELDEGTDPIAFEAKINGFIEDERGDLMRADNVWADYSLMALPDIHLNSNRMMEFEPNGNEQSVVFLVIIAGIILLIAWVNYINLATAKSLERAKEVGIRKVMGSQKNQLVIQFLSESFILNVLALLVAILLAYLLLPWFNEFTGRAIVFPFSSVFFWWFCLTVVLVGGILSGIYPSFVLSGFNPVSVLKGKLTGTSGGQLMRKSLVVFQFAASIILLICTYAIYSQISYMQNEQLGIDIDRTLVVRGPEIVDSTYLDRFNGFKDNLQKESSIQEIASSSSIPGERPEWNAGGIRLLDKPENETNQYRIIGMDEGYIDFYGLEILTGRKFSAANSGETGNVLLNESGARLMGFKNYEDALNKQILFWGDTFNIIGVAKDYHHESLKQSYDPYIFRYSPGFRANYSIRISSNDLRETIDMIEDEWNQSFAGNPYDYFFLDDFFNKQYESEVRFGNVVALFAIVAIIIACLGLFGLTLFTAMNRTREIGIRKVLGASVQRILLLLTRDFSTLIIIAAIIAVPAAWFILRAWLENFPYRIELSLWVFLVPVVLLILISLVSVGFHTLKAALQPPINSIKDE